MKVMKAVWVLSAVCVAVTALLAAPVARAEGDHGPGRGRHAITGAWRFTVDFGDVQSYNLQVFDKDHTTTGASANFSGLTSSSGVWEANADGSFSVLFEGFSDNDLDGNFDIRFQIRQTLWVDGDVLTGTLTFDVLTVAGDFVTTVQSGIPLEGERMTVIPE